LSIRFDISISCQKYFPLKRKTDFTVVNTGMQKYPNDKDLIKANAQSQLFLQAYGLVSKDRLAKTIASVKAKDMLAPVTVIVPSTYSALSLRRSLAKDNGLINVGFMALSRLAEYLGAPALAAQGKSPLSPAMKLLAIRHFAGEMNKKEPLSAISDHAPFHNYLIGTFDELSMLTEAGLSDLEGKSPVLKQILEWYRLYRGFTSSYYDTEELTKVAAISVKTGETSSTLHDLGFIIFYLVTRFSPAETELVKTLATKERCAVILGLTGDKEVDTETNLTANRLEPASDKIELAIPSRHIEASHISITPDSHEEVKFVLRHIAKSVENDIPFHKMAILYRNADPYAILIKNQVELAGMPMSGPDPQSLRDTPSGKLLVYLLDIFSSGFSRESVMRWVSEAPLQFEKTRD
jgi:ATP-dependent helicase/DNAse subunit B